MAFEPRKGAQSFADAGEWRVEMARLIADEGMRRSEAAERMGLQWKYTHYLWTAIKKELQSNKTPEQVAAKLSQGRDIGGGPLFRLANRILDEMVESKAELAAHGIVTQDEGCMVPALGLHWMRSKVNWKSPKLLAMDGRGNEIDMSEQDGVYILYDWDGAVRYVGRSHTNILVRLKSHNADKHGWERFSWFGMKRITEDGLESRDELSVEQEISMLEGVLIEALRPWDNKQPPDHFGPRYEQAEDPAVRDRRVDEMEIDLDRRRWERHAEGRSR